MPIAGLGCFWNTDQVAWERAACFPKLRPFSAEGQRENCGQPADEMAFVFYPCESNLLITPGASLIYL